MIQMKVGWILSGSKQVAGARIQGWNMHEYFLSKGIDSTIIYAPRGFQTEFSLSQNKINKVIKERYDIILVQKIQSGDGFLSFVKKAQKAGTKVVYLGIDELNIKFATACDARIVLSNYLKKEIPGKYRKKTFVVFDSYEHSGRIYKKHTNSKKIKLIFVSNNVHSKFPQIDYLPNGVSLTILGPPKERVRKFMGNKKIFTETPYKFKYLVWNLKTVEKEILKCDVGVIPIKQSHLKESYIKSKSSNRLVLFMSLGLPTIASPSDVYKRLIKQGKNGFIANNPKEWIKFIELLRDNPKKRELIGKNARKTVLNKYSIASQGRLYLKTLNRVLKFR